MLLTLWAHCGECKMVPRSYVWPPDWRLRVPFILSAGTRNCILSPQISPQRTVFSQRACNCGFQVAAKVEPAMDSPGVEICKRHHFALVRERPMWWKHLHKGNLWCLVSLSVWRIFKENIMKYNIWWFIFFIVGPLCQWERNADSTATSFTWWR